MTSAKNNVAPLFDSQAFLATLTQQAGIYKMLDDSGDIIYIGKAKNLKNRVSSYFKTPSASPKQQALLRKVAAIEVTVTNSESEALLLESQQIKHHQPRYNICLRDDKSYPYLFLSAADFPQLSFHRGAKKKKGQYFGPYPSASAVKETLKLLQKIFPVRQCEDSYYKSRSRPCLQYQIQRCTAPCVGLISQAQYQQDVDSTVLFLQGKSEVLINQLIDKMTQAATALQFEQAAAIRDKIQRLRTILEKNHVHGERGDVDIVACASQAGVACVQVFFIRAGQNLGNRLFFPKLTATDSEPATVLQAFIPQYYLERPLPAEIIISHPLLETDLLSAALTQQAGYAVTLTAQVRGERAKWLQLATVNAENALYSQLADKQNTAARFVGLQQALGCLQTPQRLECFDISHTQGECTVASCVVFTQEGALTAAYRRFNITGITPGDDYAAIYQAVARRFKRIKQGQFPVPDVLLIDGGKGQVQQAQKAVSEVGLNNVMIVGVAKGVERKAGMEKLILLNQEQPLVLARDAGALLLIQQIRDEAHRFAITGHRLRRAKAKTQSVLESIAGLGPKRRQRLLNQFGGLQGISRAGIEALCSIDGISQPLAQRIYDTFHPQNGS